MTTDELSKFSERELEAIVNESLTKAAFEYYDVNQKEKIEEAGMKKLVLDMTGEENLTNEQVKVKVFFLFFYFKINKNIIENNNII